MNNMGKVEKMVQSAPNGIITTPFICWAILTAPRQDTR